MDRMRFMRMRFFVFKAPVSLFPLSGVQILLQTMILLCENADHSINNEKHGISAHTMRSLTTSTMTTADFIIIVLLCPANL